LADPLPFGLIPGAGGRAWYWHRVVPSLERRGYEALPVDLPGDDDDSGLLRDTDLAVEAIGRRSDVVLVAQSMGAFSELLPE
jgi:pimeloyl-ACP methyl ester carboxylesterase